MEIVGEANILKNFDKLKSKVLRDTIVAVDKSAADLVNHAKAGHAGNSAHMNGRYRNRTTNLTNSITNELTKVTDTKVEAEAKAGMEYARPVEFGAFNARTGRMNRPYPFMFPALAFAKTKLKNRMLKLFK